MSNENPDNSEDAEPRSRLPMWLKVVGGVALTALTLGALVSFAEPEELWRVWRAVDPLWLAATLGVWLVMMASRASRFYALQPEVGFAKMFGINAIHTFLLRVMPFRTGEMGYVYLVRRAGAPSLAKGFFGVIIVRLLDVVMLFWAFALAVAVYGASALGDPTTGWTLGRDRRDRGGWRPGAVSTTAAAGAPRGTPRV